MLRWTMLALLAASSAGRSYAQELGHEAARDQAIAIPESDLTVTAPAGWTRVKAADGASVTVRGPAVTDPGLDDGARERARPSLAAHATVLEADQTQAGLVLTALHDLDRLLTRFQPLDYDFEGIVIGGRTWKRLHYTFEVGQIGWEQELYVTTSKRVIVYVVVSCDHDHFAANRETFRAMVASMGGSAPAFGPAAP